MAIKLAENRAKTLDEYGKIRKHEGIHAARRWLQTEDARAPLRAIARQLQDTAAKRAITRVIESTDFDEMRRIGSLLSGDKMQAAIDAQYMDEDRIRRKARAYHLVFHESEIAFRRRFRTQAKQSISFVNLTLGLIGGNSGNVHCTPLEKSLRDEQKARWTQFGESIELHRDGQSFKLSDAMSKAGARRAAEIYAMTKGLEKYAERAGKTWAFFTLTAPPNMHPNPGMGKNTWDGTTPDEAHAWIKDARERAEARCRKAEIVISGARVVEPHKDGCPHEHLMVFADPAEMSVIEAEFRKQPEWESEAGMKFVLSDGRATAASYLFKYVLKTISSVEVLSGERGSVDAWRSTWGIRAFSFFGMPPLSLWRNLRALDECPSEPLLAGLWRAAKRGDGMAFIGLAGGLNIKTKERPVVSRKESRVEEEEKQLQFTIRDTRETVTFKIQKWERRKTVEPSIGAVVGVIPNYPRNPQPLPNPVESPWEKQSTGGQGTPSAGTDSGTRRPGSRHDGAYATALRVRLRRRIVPPGIGLAASNAARSEGRKGHKNQTANAAWGRC